MEGDTFQVGSPPVSPGSPLTYSPQVAMEPLQKPDESSGQRPATEFVGAAGWPAQPKLVPVVIACECGDTQRQSLSYLPLQQYNVGSQVLVILSQPQQHTGNECLAPHFLQDGQLDYRQSLLDATSNCFCIMLLLHQSEYRLHSHSNVLSCCTQGVMVVNMWKLRVHLIIGAPGSHCSEQAGISQSSSSYLLVYIRYEQQRADEDVQHAGLVADMTSRG